MRSRTGTAAPIEELTPTDVRYPDRLRSGPAPAPERLWLRGRWPLEGQPVVAMVGARAATGHAMARARDLAAELAGRGALVVSGGAIGIDAAAHAGAILAGRPTLAVLAPGLDDPYPARHRPLFERILDGGGALLSAVAPGTPLQRWQFPARNEIMAALADVVVVVECAAASGTMTTARAAARLGRALCACPGTTGTEALIAAGAGLAEGADDVLAAAAGRPRLPAPPLPDPKSDEGRVLSALDAASARAAEEVGERAGLGALVAARALVALEIDGLAIPAPGGRYLRAAYAVPQAPAA